MNAIGSRIALAHPRLDAGGSEACAMWALQVLQGEFDVTLLTGGSVEWRRLNATYGTQVCPEKVRVLHAPMPKFLKADRFGDALLGAYFGRYCRQAGPWFDLCVSTYNIVDFGRPGLQFLADFSWADEPTVGHGNFALGLRSMMRRRSPLRKLYLAATDAVSGRRNSVCRADDTVVANSHWSADILRRRYGVHARVIYPPVTYENTKAGGINRTQDFVVLGRISPEKRIEEAIEILSAVRQRGHDVRLHILGPLDRSPYSRRMRRLARRAGSWVVLQGGLYGCAKASMLERHGFGLHLCRKEAFGIAVAEMVKAGMVPFVPACSAPAEIVADVRLTFGGSHEAVERIDTVLRGPDDTAELRNRLRTRAERLFSADRFVSEFRSLVMEKLT